MLESTNRYRPQSTHASLQILQQSLRPPLYPSPADAGNRAAPDPSRVRRLGAIGEMKDPERTSPAQQDKRLRELPGQVQFLPISMSRTPLRSTEQLPKLRLNAHRAAVP